MPDIDTMTGEQPLPAQDGDLAPASGQAAWSSEHPVDVRLTIPLVFGRYYIAIVCGKERRSDQRLRVERRRHPLITAGNTAFFFGLGSLVGLAALALLNMLTAFYYGQG